MTKEKDTNSIKKPKSKKLILLTTIIIATTTIISYFAISTSYKTPLLVHNNNKTPLKISKTKRLVKTTIEDKNFTRDLQIEELQEKFKELELKLNTIKLDDNLSKIILSFAELRALIEMEQNYEVKLQEFSTLAVKDPTLTLKAEELAKILKDKNYNVKDIADEFQNSIDKIIILKSKDNANDKFIDKIKNNLPKLVIVRRIDGKVKNADDAIDLTILQIEQYIASKSYQKALNKIETLDQKYQEELHTLISMLKNQIELEQISNTIFLYLKRVVNNV